MTIWERWTSLSQSQQESIRSLRQVAEAIIESINIVYTKRESVKDHRKIISELNRVLESIEFDMQHAWGFEEDSRKHTWWLKPSACTCPKLDNTDPAYFGGGKIINEACPIHGYYSHDDAGDVVTM